MNTHRFKISKATTYTFLIVLLLLSVIPFYLVTINSTFKLRHCDQTEFTARRGTCRELQTMQSHVNIWRGFANSLLIAIPYTIITGYFGAFTAYGFAKYQFRVRISSSPLFWHP